MIIDSKPALMRNRKLQFLMPILFIVGIGLALSDEILFFINYTYPSVWIIWFFAVVYILFIIYNIIKNEYFFYLSDNEEGIKVRYYKLMMINFASSHKQILVPKHQFYKYEIKTSFFNIRKQIIFYLKKDSKIAKYPPISISTFKKNEIKMIEDILNKYTLVK